MPSVYYRASSIMRNILTLTTSLAPLQSWLPRINEAVPQSTKGLLYAQTHPMRKRCYNNKNDLSVYVCEHELKKSVIVVGDACLLLDI